MEITRQRLPSADRQAGIVQAAIQLAAGRDPATLTTSEIATSLGLTQGALFRHFPSKQAIWLAVVSWVEETLLARIDRAASAVDALEALAAVYRAHVAFVMEFPGVPRILFHELQQPAESAVKQRVAGLLMSYRSRVAALLVRGRAAGLIDAGVDLDNAAALFLGSIQGLVMQAMIAGTVAGMGRASEGVLELYLAAIRRASP